MPRSSLASVNNRCSCFGTRLYSSVAMPSTAPRVFKTVAIGAHRVGKTSIIEQLVNATYEPEKVHQSNFSDHKGSV